MTKTSFPLVSIVLPTYNGSKYLELSIQSCLDQTYPYWELILVDDASTDSTPDIIAKYVALDKRIRSIRHETNKKIPSGLNTGFSASEGTYLTWTSDDNLYRPNALAEMVAFLESHSEIGLVYTDYTEIDGTGEECREVLVDDYRKVLVFKACVGPSFMYRRGVYETIGEYDKALFLAEDYDYWLQVATRFTMHPLHNNLYLYRRHVSSWTSKGAKDARWLAREKTILRNLPNLKWVNKQLQAEAYLHIAGLAWARRDRKKGLAYLVTSMGYNPWLGLRRGLFKLVQLTLGKHFAQKIGASYVWIKGHL